MSADDNSGFCGVWQGMGKYVKILWVVESLKETQGIVGCKKWLFLYMSRGLKIHLSGGARHTYFISGSTIKYCGIYVQGKDPPGMYTVAWCKH